MFASLPTGHDQSVTFPRRAQNTADHSAKAGGRPPPPGQEVYLLPPPHIVSYSAGGRAITGSVIMIIRVIISNVVIIEVNWLLELSL